MRDPKEDMMARSVPWHRPGQWRVNPMYWESEALAERRIAILSRTKSVTDAYLQF